MTVFQLFYEMKLKTSKFKVLLFWSQQNMTKFKSQAVHIIRIKYWKASGCSNTPCLVPALPKIAILGLKTKFYVLFCTRLDIEYFFLLIIQVDQGSLLSSRWLWNITEMTTITSVLSVMMLIWIMILLSKRIMRWLTCLKTLGRLSCTAYSPLWLRLDYYTQKMRGHR